MQLELNTRPVRPKNTVFEKSPLGADYLVLPPMERLKMVLPRTLERELDKYAFRADAGIPFDLREDPCRDNSPLQLFLALSLELNFHAPNSKEKRSHRSEMVGKISLEYNPLIPGVLNPDEINSWSVTVTGLFWDKPNWT